MISSLSYEWKKPIRFAPDLATQLSELVTAFQADAFSGVLKEAGLGSAEFPNPASLVENYNDHNNRKVDYNTAWEAEKIFRLSWSVRLRDGTKIANLTRDQLLLLNNVSSSSVVYLQMDCGSSERSLSMHFSSNGSSSSTSMSLRGDFDTVQKYRRCIVELLQRYTQPWWIFRNGPLFSSIWTIFAILANANSLIDVVRTQKDPYATLNLGVAIPAITIFLMLMIPLATSAIGVWNWLFPMTEYQFGGGIQTSEIRRNVRRILWIVPITMIAIPYFVNHLN